MLGVGVCVCMCVFQCFWRREVIEIIFINLYLLFQEKDKEKTWPVFIVHVIQLVPLDYIIWK